MSQDPDINKTDNPNPLTIKRKYSHFFEKITKSAQKAKSELSKVAQQINGKSYKCIDKTIEQQQEQENYSLSTNNIHQQDIKQNCDNSDESDDDWIEIKITKKPKQQPKPVNTQIMHDRNIDNHHKDDNKPTHPEQKSYLDTIHSLNAENDNLLKQFNELKQRFNENNPIEKNHTEWQCSQCTLVQTIYNDQCTMCHSKNPSFELLDEKQTIYDEQRRREINNDNDRLFALKLQQEYKTMQHDEKLAMELQKMEEKQPQNIRILVRRVNSYPARPPPRQMYNSNRSVIGSILMGMLGVVEVPVNNYNISNNNDIEEKEINNVEHEWKRLPVRLLTGNDILLLHKNEEKKSCPICLLDFKIKDEIRELPCFHLFHRQCIDIWFKQQNGKGNYASCPLDRKKIIDGI